MQRGQAEEGKPEEQERRSTAVPKATIPKPTLRAEKNRRAQAVPVPTLQLEKSFHQTRACTRKMLECFTPKTFGGLGKLMAKLFCRFVAEARNAKHYKTGVVKPPVA